MEGMNIQNITFASASECVEKMMMEGIVAKAMTPSMSHTILLGLCMLGRPSMHSPKRIVWLMGGVIAFATIPSIIIFSTHSLALAKVMFWIFIPSIYFYIGPCYGILNNLSPPRMRAQFCAATLLVANVGNLIIAPQLIGFLSDLFAPGH